MSAPPRVEHEAASVNVLRADGSDVLTFRSISPDSLLLADDSGLLPGGSSRLSGGAKDFCSATGGTAAGHACAADTLWQSAALHRAVELTAARCREKLGEYDAMERECRYFLAHSGIQDEGFTAVEQYAAGIDSLRRRTVAVMKALQAVAPKARLTVAHKTKPAAGGIAPEPLFIESMGGVWRGGRWYKEPRLSLIHISEPTRPY